MKSISPLFTLRSITLFHTKKYIYAKLFYLNNQGITQLRAFQQFRTLINDKLQKISKFLFSILRILNIKQQILIHSFSATKFIMRVMSPPKHHSQFQSVKSPVRNESILSNISNQTQRTVHQLKPSQTTRTCRAHTLAIKQTLYLELRNRQLECGQIIQQLNKENHSLKAQLGNAQFQQSKRPSFTTFISISPQKVDLNRTISDNRSESFNLRKFSNNQLMNQTISGYHPPTVQQAQTLTVRPKLSPFSKKPVIMSHTSPVGYRPGMVTVFSPSKKTVRPASNFLKVSSNTMTIRSPQKRQVNHSYKPSLVSFKYPSQQQSLDCSPKKSFETIIGLNSQIFSNTTNSQYHPEYTCQEIIEAKNSNFFDMKKRQLNYGSVFNKQKLKSSSQTIKSTLKMSTKHLLLNQPEPLQTVDNKNQENYLNPLNTKRKKKEIGFQEQITEILPQVSQESKPKQFNLEQNIQKNPLLNMLKKRLQQEVNFLNGFVNQAESIQAVPLFEQATKKNPNIRYSCQTSEPISASDMVHPLKSNILQSFPLRNVNTAQNEQIPQQQIENEVNIYNQNTKGSLESNISRSQSRLSDKVSKQNISQLIIPEVQNAQKTMTIVRMLDETKRLGNYDPGYDDEVQLIYQNDQQIGPSTESIGINRESFQDEKQTQGQNRHFYEDEVYFQGQAQEQQEQQQQVEKKMISNRYYCQNTQQNQNFDSNSIKSLKEPEPENLILKNTKPVFIDQTQNGSKKITSNQIIDYIQKDNPTQQKQIIQIQSEKVSQKQLSPSKFYSNLNQVESQNSEQIQRLNKSAQYATFYVNKNNINLRCYNQNERKGSKGGQKYQESRISDAWTQNSLRSQKFKKISNVAYL